MYLNTIPAYIYKITHLPTGRYYFGFRKAHIKFGRTPEQDFLIYYFTSSPELKSMILTEGIEHFQCEILYRNLDIVETFWYEQDLIKSHWGDTMMINRQYRERQSSKGVFLTLEKMSTETIKKRKETNMNKYGRLHHVTQDSIEKMVATRRSRDNYKQSEQMKEKMVATKRARGNLNSNTPESREKSKKTKLKRYGCAQPKHTEETIAYLKTIPHTRERIDKCIATKKANGTLNSNTPETIAQRKKTLMEKWGTLNTREIARLKKNLEK